eukprot:CAMPEP_0182424144 /NCGR_PEP_ID=MMETSP1167-20130531/10300_1 /TAXON_ID=2988 /ORGANISM="Mallomonas Sp, Strain CCMP3275" /LENGTH=689 /DNA_ID=CAMNT_0024603713 /DNA_START=93 /DNA_END=2162 /DNA_ORIENTATION=-
MSKVTCECDDGSFISVSLTSLSTCQDLIAEICKLKSSQSDSMMITSQSSQRIRLGVTNAAGEVVVIPDNNIKLSAFLQDGMIVKVAGFRHRANTSNSETNPNASNINIFEGGPSAHDESSSILEEAKPIPTSIETESSAVPELQSILKHQDTIDSKCSETYDLISTPAVASVPNSTTENLAIEAAITAVIAAAIDGVTTTSTDAPIHASLTASINPIINNSICKDAIVPSVIPATQEETSEIGKPVMTLESGQISTQPHIDREVLLLPSVSTNHEESSSTPIIVDSLNSQKPLLTANIMTEQGMNTGNDKDTVAGTTEESTVTTGRKKRSGRGSWNADRPCKYRKKSKAGSKEQLTVHHAKLKLEAAARNSFCPEQAELDKLKAERTYMSEGALDEEWDSRFDLMLAYGNAVGTCNVPWGCIVRLPNQTEVRLGYWLHEQRQNHKKFKLRVDREKRLQALVDQNKLAWVMDGTRARSLVVTDDAGWDLQYDLLLKYGEEHDGNCNVPWGYSCPSPDGSGVDVKLGYWLKAQRSNRKNGKLRPDRLARLQPLVDAGKLRWSKKEVLDEPTMLLSNSCDPQCTSEIFLAVSGVLSEIVDAVVRVLVTDDINIDITASNINLNDSSCPMSIDNHPDGMPAVSMLVKAAALAQPANTATIENTERNIQSFNVPRDMAEATRSHELLVKDIANV